MFPFENTYARLPERFFAKVAPAKVRAPRVVKVNPAVAELLRIDPAALPLRAAELLSGIAFPESSSAMDARSSSARSSARTANGATCS